MDVIIPLVDCSDKVWMEGILKLGIKPPVHLYTPEVWIVSALNFQLCYFYNYNTIKYALRGIDKFMPYVDNVFLVVSNIEQVPDYIDQSKVKVILHKDFIPEKYLPTYQANTIEMFMHKIPGLGEEFVYFNDDMIPIAPIAYDELFQNGLPCINFEENNRDPRIPTYKMCVLSFYEAYNAVRMMGNKIPEENVVKMPIHAPTPLLKSECDKAASMSRHSALLDFYTSTFRRPKNLNQYYWADLLYFQKKYVPSDIKLKYLKSDEIGDNLDMESIQKEYKYICINDYGTDIHPLSELENIISTGLDTILPEKSKYENNR